METSLALVLQRGKPPPIKGNHRFIWKHLNQDKHLSTLFCDLRMTGMWIEVVTCDQTNVGKWVCVRESVRLQFIAFKNEREIFWTLSVENLGKRKYQLRKNCSYSFPFTSTFPLLVKLSYHTIHVPNSVHSAVNSTRGTSSSDFPTSDGTRKNHAPAVVQMRPPLSASSSLLEETLTQTQTSYQGKHSGTFRNHL